MNTKQVFEWSSMAGGLLGFLLNETRNANFSEIEKELAPLDITSAQFKIVIGIAHERASTLTEFARFFDYDPGAMKRLIDRVEQKGLIRRVPSQVDRRIINLELTEQGTELYPQIMAVVSKVNRKMLDGFSDVETAQLQFFLQRVISNARK
ncbi:MarR family winged helix-turn-helix transcriptional regulator [Massilia sp. 2TAF26]|uniref:MarR family winged helix-turn-helix transcriptional regulator n=1 Tax=Massilia sp. 2TAF26 TaxID=3233012 RepID=UPI003F9E5F7C